MLEITIPPNELWDERKNEFVKIKGQTITLEHSLVSISKWEAKYKKPFLSKEPKTSIETVDYIKCMTITQNVDPMIYNFISKEDYQKINEYIDDPMSATIINELGGKQNNRNKIITSELLYYWMIALNIPPEYRKWHLNRLIMLIRVCDIKNRSDDKMNRKDTLNYHRAVNAARRKSKL